MISITFSYLNCSELLGSEALKLTWRQSTQGWPRRIGLTLLPLRHATMSVMFDDDGDYDDDDDHDDNNIACNP